MEPIFRNYLETDYHRCQELVEEAWDFKQHFQPGELADLAGLMYTKGSLLGSDHQRVVEVNGEVVGFIFGRNESSFKPKRHFLFGLEVLWRLMRIKGLSKPDRKRLIHAITTHEKNRLKVVASGKSEIVLFVVSNKYQGLGYGKRLLGEFVENCMASHINPIIVETNILEAASFYERVGFTHKANFYSPLHEYVSKGGQACIYEIRCKLS